jgi:hypothetical protein
MARRVGWILGYRQGPADRIPHTQHTSGMLRPLRRRRGSTTLRVARPRRRR